MRKGGGKAKGNGFEWEVCRRLSLWWSAGKSRDIFCPTDSSGGRATFRRRTGDPLKIHQDADITFADPDGQSLIETFYIECKSGYGVWDTLDLIDSKKKEPELIKFWTKCALGAVDTQKIPVIIFRRNRRSICVAMRRSDFDYYFSSRLDHGVRIEVAGVAIHLVIIPLSILEECIFDLKEFFINLRPFAR